MFVFVGMKKCVCVCVRACVRACVCVYVYENDAHMLVLCVHFFPLSADVS